MSGRRAASGLGALAGFGMLGLLCCIALPAALGAIAGSAIGGVLGVAAAAAIAIGAGLLVRHRRAAGGRDC